MIVFEIIWNIIGVLFAMLGLLLCSMVVFLAMAMIAGMADKGVNKKKGKDNGKVKE